MRTPLSSALVAAVTSFAIVACSALEEDGESQASALGAECTSGATVRCPCGIREGTYLCSAKGRIPREQTGKIGCQCEDTPAPLDPSPPAGDAAPSDEPEAPSVDDAGPPRNAAGDSCATLDRVPTREISRGSTSRFPVEVGGLQDDFKSSCAQAIGPDRIQPLLARASGTMAVSVVAGLGFVGVPVLYAKSECFAHRATCSAPESVWPWVSAKPGPTAGEPSLVGGVSPQACGSTSNGARSSGERFGIVSSSS